jgi:hypothetical protein
MKNILIIFFSKCNTYFFYIFFLHLYTPLPSLGELHYAPFKKKFNFSVGSKSFPPRASLSGINRWKLLGYRWGVVVPPTAFPSMFLLSQQQYAETCHGEDSLNRRLASLGLSKASNNKLC